MSNTDNLVSFGVDRPPLSHEEAVKQGSIGGKASAEARRKKKSLREEMKSILADTNNIDGNGLSLREVICSGLKKEPTKMLEFVYKVSNDKSDIQIMSENVLKAWDAKGKKEFNPRMNEKLLDLVEKFIGDTSLEEMSDDDKGAIHLLLLTASVNTKMPPEVAEKQKEYWANAFSDT